MDFREKAALFLGAWIATQHRRANCPRCAHKEATEHKSVAIATPSVVKVAPAPNDPPKRRWRGLAVLRLVATLALLALAVQSFRISRPIGQPAVARRWPRALDQDRSATDDSHVSVAIVGGGAAGLNMAFELERHGVRDYRVFEKGSDPGATWAARYDRLHLHTIADVSALPGVPFPAHWPQFVARDQMVRYYRAAKELLLPGKYLLEHMVTSATFQPTVDDSLGANTTRDWNNTRSSWSWLESSQERYHKTPGFWCLQVQDMQKPPAEGGEEAEAPKRRPRRWPWQRRRAEEADADGNGQSSGQAGWSDIVNDARGASCDYTADALVLATGIDVKPKIPIEWLSFVNQTFSRTGSPRVLHSAHYTNGASFRHERVAVIGLGNSGAEIAMDLYEHGASKVFIVASKSVHVVPRWLTSLLGQFYSLTRLLPVETMDKLERYLRPLVVGNLRSYRIKQRESGILSDLRYGSRPPILDIGTLRLLKNGWIRILGPGAAGEVASVSVSRDAGGRIGRERFGLRMAMRNNASVDVDAVILATGFEKAGFFEFLDESLQRCLSAVTNAYHDWANAFGDGREARECVPLLYGVGYTDFMGRLAEMGREADLIAKDLRRKEIISAAE